MRLLRIAVFSWVIFGPPLFAGEGFIRRMPESISDLYVVALDPRGSRDVAREATDISRAHGGTVTAVVTSTFKGFVIRIPAAGAEALSKNPRVAYVEEVARVRITDSMLSTFSEDTNTDIDPASGLWHLDRLDDMQLEDGLDGYYRWCVGANVKAYVVDTGIRADHSYFQPGQVTDGGAPDFSGDSNGTPTNPCSGHRWAPGAHGTAVASVLAARAVNETCPQYVQTPGVAKGLPLVAIRAYDCWAFSDSARVLQALEWILNNGTTPSVVNISGHYLGTSASIQTAITNLSEGGFAVFVAANNFPSETACQKEPAAFSRSNSGKAVTVGGTMIGPRGNGLDPDPEIHDLRDFRWQEYDQNGDPILVQDGGSSKAPCIDIWAPAKGIRVADYSTTTATMHLSGTSLSTPIAAGVGARYFQVNGGTPDSMWTWMSANAIRTRQSDGSSLINDTGAALPPMLLFQDWCWTRLVCQ